MGKRERRGPILKLTVYGPDCLRDPVYEAVKRVLRISRSKWERGGLEITWKMKRIGGEKKDAGEDEG